MIRLFKQETFTPKKAAEILGVSIKTIYKMVDDNSLKIKKRYLRNKRYTPIFILRESLQNCYIFIKSM
jgi:excisionase family DNA binding protein